jgi:MoaA/NifB/PqqE/SkfB family radical SAM enzyme
MEMEILNYSNKLVSKNYKEWLFDFHDKKVIYPQIVELDPTTNCSFSCPDCISANLLNGPTFSQESIHDLVDELSDIGVKGIILIGGGEPMMFPKFDKLLKHCNNNKIHVGITTNGLLIDKYVEEIALFTDWVRVSLDASNEETFQKIRPNRVKNSFSQILSGIKSLNQIKKGLVGISFLLVESDTINNCSELYDAAILSKNLGCDYFEYKPMVDENHFLVKYSDVFLNEVKKQEELMNSLNSENFTIIKPHSIEQYKKEKQTQPKHYHECPVMKLRTLVTPNGIYPCPYKRGFEDLNFGKVECNFKEVFESEFDSIYKKVDPSWDCNFFCIRNDINEFLLDVLEDNINLQTLSFDVNDDVFV